MNCYQEQSREIPVIAHVDVFVASGGPAGTGAALGAAKNGASVMIADEMNCFGGMMSHWTGLTDSPVMEAIQKRCRLEPWASEKFEDVNPLAINHEKAKLAIFDMLEEAGVRMRLHTRCADVIMEGTCVKGVILESKSGRQAVMCKVLIDCTGDGDLAARTGAEFQLGREEDHRMQPVTLMFKIEGVDPGRMIAPGCFEALVDVPKGEIQALARKHLPAPAGHVLLYPSVVPGQVVVNMTNLTDINGADADDLTKAEIVCHRQIPKIIAFLREFAPGYENCSLHSVAANVGVRETRHFKGEYTVVPDDIVDARLFDDWIAVRNFFNFDIHNVDGAGLDKDGVQRHFTARGQYSLPYRAILPEKVEHLLLCGRNISGTHKAHSNFRVMPICANLGLGAGTAAALAAKQGVAPRNLDIHEVQAALKNLGVEP